MKMRGILTSGKDSRGMLLKDIDPAMSRMIASTMTVTGFLTANLVMGDSLYLFSLRGLVKRRPPQSSDYLPTANCRGMSYTIFDPVATWKAPVVIKVSPAETPLSMTTESP